MKNLKKKKVTTTTTPTKVSGDPTSSKSITPKISTSSTPKQKTLVKPTATKTVAAKSGIPSVAKEPGSKVAKPATTTSKPASSKPAVSSNASKPTATSRPTTAASRPSTAKSTISTASATSNTTTKTTTSKKPTIKPATKPANAATSSKLVTSTSTKSVSSAASAKMSKSGPVKPTKPPTASNKLTKAPSASKKSSREASVPAGSTTIPASPRRPTPAPSRPTSAAVPRSTSTKAISRATTSTTISKADTTTAGVKAKSPRPEAAVDNIMISSARKGGSDISATNAANRIRRAALADLSNKLAKPSLIVPSKKPQILQTPETNVSRPIIKVKYVLGSKMARIPSTPDTTKMARATSSKSPRQNLATVGKAQTTPDLNAVSPRHIAAGSRSVSVGANLTRAAPAGRRKPTVNPVKSRQALSEKGPQGSSQRSAAGFFSGMGILAAVGPTDGHEFGQIQLRKATEEKPKVLLIHVKGRRNLSARLAEPSYKSLNKDDAFVVVDAATRRIFEWRGAHANKIEIARAMDIAGRIKNKEFGGRADMFLLEDGKNDQSTDFWQLLGGKGAIPLKDARGEDEEVEKLVRKDRLYGIIEKVQGTLELDKVADNKFNKEMLQSGRVFLLDCLTELYMWVGKGCPGSHRTVIAAKAQDILTKVKERPKWVSISRVIEGAEPEVFKEKFWDWPSTLPITMAAVPKGNVAAAKAAIKFDVMKLFQSPKRDDKVIDDGTGKVEIWRVKDHSKEPIEQNMYGQFFDTESYVILYKYMVKNREVFVIYFWQGKKSSITEKGSSALLTVDLDDTVGGTATQIRVVQNKESKHFMKLFGGFIIVHKACETEDGASLVPETALYQIRSCNNVDGIGCDVRTVPLVSPSAKYLNTNDIFLLNTPEKQYIWLGANSSKFVEISKEILVQLGSRILASREQIFIQEGDEPADFWEIVGEAEYFRTAWKFMPRMFHCSSASGSFVAEEVLEWDQEDLDPGHLNILDTSTDIFLWTGQRAYNIEEEKKQSMEVALQYAKLHPIRKLEENNADRVLCVNALRESLNFKAAFHCWDDSKSKGADESIIHVADLLAQLSRTYTLPELLNPPKMLDSTKLENYLSAEEFAEIFKMARDAFAAQPLWKQEQQKKSVGLY